MVSIIMPVFNSEKTIKRSINSVINQTFNDWELIIVDNGSTDDTENICRDFQNKYSQIFYYKCYKRGVVLARNMGVIRSKGEYISFLDSDDAMCSNMLKMLVEAAINKNADIVSCGYFNVDDFGNIQKCLPRYYGVCDQEKFFECLFQVGTMGFLWNKLYKKEVYNQSIQPIDMEVCEDLYINCSLALKPRKIIILNECLYEYYVNLKSVTRKIDNKISSNGEWKYLVSYKKIEKLFVKDMKKIKRIKKAELFVIKLGLEELESFEDNYNTRKILLKEMKSTFPLVFVENISLKFKIGYLKRFLIESMKVIGK